MRKGEELKAPHYTSAAAIRDYIIVRDIIPNKWSLNTYKMQAYNTILRNASFI